MADYLGDLRERRVYRQMSSREIRDRLDATLPTKGIDFDALLKIFRETIIPFSRQNAHPRMFGYVQSPGTPLAAFADLLASTLNANLTDPIDRQAFHFHRRRRRTPHREIGV